MDTTEMNRREREIKSSRAYREALGCPTSREVMLVEDRYIRGEFATMREFDMAYLDAAGIVMTEEEYQALIAQW